MDGVILPETSKEDVHFGKVISIGRGYIQPDGTYRPMSLVVGNTIAYGQYAGIPAQVGGVEFLVMKEGEALFLLNDEEAT
jgi:chaperonin GroES